ncbi:MAG: 4Fe-4S dicluster domain-containing protein [Candidatus Helarchaeota archaeon]
MQTNNIIIHEENCTGCLTCQLICSFIHKKIFNPADSYIIIEAKNDEKKIGFTSECNNCGVCAKYCLYKALEKV